MHKNNILQGKSTSDIGIPLEKMMIFISIRYLLRI